MHNIELIEKKRDGQKLSKSEINTLIQAYCRDAIPDYQMAALLMAIYFQGMDAEETAFLTGAMLNSGEKLGHKAKAARIDKHSTGGVGDKISLILAPLVACCDIAVPMISGRGLLHSGGTLDKLESIPRFRTDLSMQAFSRQLLKINVVMAGQSGDLVPADKKLYALREATATVASVPLITASILSKKLAENIDGLVLDIKCGRGAFMPTLDQAENLAFAMIATARPYGLPTTALITDMNHPLGYAVGNWLEIKEAIQCLHGRGPDDVMQLVYALSSQMLILAGKTDDESSAQAVLQDKIRSGEAWQKFLDLVRAQHGDTSVLQNPQRYDKAKYEEAVYAPQAGYVSAIDAMKIGMAVVYLGGGRATKEESINHKAGIVLNVQRGARVKSGAVLARLYSDDPIAEKLCIRVQSAFDIGRQPGAQQRILKAISTKNQL